MTKFERILRRAKKRLAELNNEEAKLKRMALKATEGERLLEREERLAHIEKEKYRLKKEVERAKLEYLKVKHARQKAEKSTGSDSLLSKANKALDSLFGTPKKTTKKKATAKTKKDPWNFWD